MYHLPVVSHLTRSAPSAWKWKRMALGTRCNNQNLSSNSDQKYTMGIHGGVEQSNSDYYVG